MVAPHAETRFFEHEILGLELLSKVRMFFLQQDPKTGTVASQTANCSGPLDPINKDCVEIGKRRLRFIKGMNVLVQIEVFFSSRDGFCSFFHECTNPSRDINNSRQFVLERGRPRFSPSGFCLSGNTSSVSALHHQWSQPVR